MRSDSGVDYVRLHADCCLVANRPAEADVEMTASCLPCFVDAVCCRPGTFVFWSQTRCGKNSLYWNGPHYEDQDYSVWLDLSCK